MSLSGESTIDLKLIPDGSGVRVVVLVDSRIAATSVENSDYEAAVIGVGMAHRALAAWKEHDDAKR